ncbi:MAG: T9SS type A sorting domain-containing protein [Bacteroidia bacterium]|nr:T9SS type A sorting domain-containing protein [Bacteroidia bacterium]
MFGAVNNDTILLDTLTQIFSYQNNSFISKFDTDLKMKWAKFMTTSSIYTGVSDISTDSVCNSYIVGKFQPNINFGSVNLTTSGPEDLFIAKYDSNGVFQWARQGYNTTGGVYSPFIKSLNNGDFYIAGPYDGTELKFGTFTISYVNAYIARYDNAGNALNVITLPGSGYCEGLSVDTADNFCIIGYFGGTLNIGAYSVTSHGFGDVYVAKHDMITREGLKMLNTNNQLIIYANPNAGKCTITIPNEFNTETKLTLQIFDNTGHLLQQTPVEMLQDKISVNITAEAKGTYTAVLSNGKKSYTGKIIFE